MGSNWTEGVVDLGLGDTRATLAARLLTDPTRAITNAPTGFTNQVRVWYLPPNSAASYLQTVQAKFPGQPHFPYGYSVAPPTPA